MDRASILVDSILGIFIGLIAAYAIDAAIPFFGLENSFADYRMQAMFQTAQGDGHNLGDAAIFISTANGQATLVEAQAAGSGSYTDPYTGKTLAENYAETLTGTMSVSVDGNATSLPLTIVAGPDGSLYAPPIGSSAPCHQITLTLTYQAATSQTVSVTVPCGGS